MSVISFPVLSLPLLCFLFIFLWHVLEMTPLYQQQKKYYLNVLHLIVVVDLCSYQSTLKQLFQEFDDGDGDVDADAQLTNITTRIMQALQTNLDGKSKQYKDPALTQLFLMNNIHYIVRSVRRCVLCLACFVGDEIFAIHTCLPL